MADIWQLEEDLWTGDAAIYRERMADDCLMQFPAGEGRMDAEAVRAALDKVPRWTTVELTGKEERKTPGTILLAYHAKADRDGEAKPYEAWAVSLWRYPDDPKLVFHQQTVAKS